MHGVIDLGDVSENSCCVNTLLRLKKKEVDGATNEYCECGTLVGVTLP